MDNVYKKEEMYKLYRTVKEILHPTISKKNISNYKIVVDENMLPLRIFYPKKVTDMKNVIIYIHGDTNITNCKEKYSEISNDIALNTDYLVFSIDQEKLENLSYKKQIKKIFDIIKYLIEELNKLDITNIKLLGDSTGGTIILNIKEQLKENNLNIEKYILFYPVLSNKYITKKNKNNKSIFDNTITIIGTKDEYYEELKTITTNIVEIPNIFHGFLKEKNENIKNKYIEIMKGE